ncbi:hypothetical protein Aperf_G00000105080 [Anoplocephala perfoliata]
MANRFFGNQTDDNCGDREVYSKRLNIPMRQDPASADSLMTSAEDDLDLFSKRQSKFFSRFFTGRLRPSRSFDEPSTATTTTTASGVPESRLPFRRPALRISKVSPGNFGRRVRHACRRVAVFLLTTTLFSFTTNMLFRSVKLFYRLPENITVGNITTKSDDVVDAPALLVYLLTSSLIIFLPISLFASCCFEHKADSIVGLFRVYVVEVTEGYATWSLLIWRSLAINTLWTVFIYCIVRGLRHLSVTDMAILLGILPPYSYLFSWVLIPKKFVAFRIIALILASCGMIFLVYFDPQHIHDKVISICGIVLMGLFTTFRRNLIGELSVTKVTGFYGFLGFTHAILTWPLFVALSVLTSIEPINWQRFPWPKLIVAIVAIIGMLTLHEIAQIVNGTALFRLHVLAVFPVAVCHDIFWRGDLSYFDKVRIASSVLIVSGGLITALPTRLYEEHDLISKVPKNIEEWNQLRRSPLGAYLSAVSSTAASGTTSGGPATASQPVKSTNSLASSNNAFPGNENMLCRPTLALPMRRRSLLQSNNISPNRGKW